MKNYPLTELQRAVYEMLCHTARRGMVCPNYGKIAEIVGASSGGTIATVIQSLVRKGYITKQGLGGSQAVIVTITDTEQTTSMPSHLSLNDFGDQVNYTDVTECWWCGSLSNTKFSCRRCK